MVNFMAARVCLLFALASFQLAESESRLQIERLVDRHIASPRQLIYLESLFERDPRKRTGDSNPQHETGAEDSPKSQQTVRARQISYHSPSYNYYQPASQYSAFNNRGKQNLLPQPIYAHPQQVPFGHRDAPYKSWHQTPGRPLISGYSNQNGYSNYHNSLQHTNGLYSSSAGYKNHANSIHDSEDRRKNHHLPELSEFYELEEPEVEVFMTKSSRHGPNEVRKVLTFKSATSRISPLDYERLWIDPDFYTQEESTATKLDDPIEEEDSQPHKLRQSESSKTSQTSSTTEAPVVKKEEDSKPPATTKVPHFSLPSPSSLHPASPSNGLAKSGAKKEEEKPKSREQEASKKPQRVEVDQQKQDQDKPLGGKHIAKDKKPQEPKSSEPSKESKVPSKESKMPSKEPKRPSKEPKNQHSGNQIEKEAPIESLGDESDMFVGAPADLFDKLIRDHLKSEGKSDNGFPNPFDILGNNNPFSI